MPSDQPCCAFAAFEDENRANANEVSLDLDRRSRPSTSYDVRFSYRDKERCSICDIHETFTGNVSELELETCLFCAELLFVLCFDHYTGLIHQVIVFEIVWPYGS